MSTRAMRRVCTVISLVLFAAIAAQAQQTVTVTNETPFMKALSLRLEGRTAEAMKILDEMLVTNPRDVDALAGRGFCRLRDGEHLDLALEDFKKTIELAPLYVDAYVGAATVYRRTGEYGKAATILDDCARVCAGDQYTERRGKNQLRMPRRVQHIDFFGKI